MTKALNLKELKERAATPEELQATFIAFIEQYNEFTYAVKGEFQRIVPQVYR
jgi:hypothetical protein